MIYFAIITVLIFLIFLNIQYGIFMPSVKGLPILLYHKISQNYNGLLTITEAMLEEQFTYILNNSYTTITFKDLIDYHLQRKPLPEKPIIITFDDGFLNNYTYLYPLLKKYNLKATIFLTVQHIGDTNKWDNGSIKLLDYSDLKNMGADFIEYGIHTYNHKNLKNRSPEFVRKDIEKCYAELDKNEINYVKVLAYPYGSYPKSHSDFKSFTSALHKCGIIFGLRIGNKINKLPITNPYLVKRIDIRGTDSFWTFKTKLKKGRVKMF